MTDTGCSMHAMHVMHSAGMTWLKHAALQSFGHGLAAEAFNAALCNALECECFDLWLFSCCLAAPQSALLLLQGEASSGGVPLHAHHCKSMLPFGNSCSAVSAE